MNSKFLIISSWAPPDIGGPQSLYNLFSQFPPQSYSILTGYYSELHRKTGPWLPCDYYFFDHTPIPLNAQPKQVVQPLPSAPSPKPSLVTRIWELMKGLVRSIGLIKTIILGFLFVKKTWRFYWSGYKILHQDKNTNIIGLSDTGAAVLAGYFLSQRLNRELYYYLYDLYKGNNFEAPSNWIANFFEKRMFTQATRIIVTNEGTRDYYLKRYPSLADRFAVVHNSTFPEQYDQKRTLYNPRPPYRIVFTGHVYWAQELSVLNLIQAMKKLSDLPLNLELYIPSASPVIKKVILGQTNILLTSAPPGAMPQIQSQATLLFLPLAWNTKAPDIIATATPGKFTDYLASGRPMLIHAPDYAYVSRYGKENNLGLVVDQNSVDALAKAIRDFLADPAQGQKYIDNALRVFHQNHDAHKNAIKLTELLKMV